MVRARQPFDGIPAQEKVVTIRIIFVLISLDRVGRMRRDPRTTKVETNPRSR